MVNSLPVAFKVLESVILPLAVGVFCYTVAVLRKNTQYIKNYNNRQDDKRKPIFRYWILYQSSLMIFFEIYNAAVLLYSTSDNSSPTTLKGLFYVVESAHCVLLPLYFVTYINFIMNQVEKLPSSLSPSSCCTGIFRKSKTFWYGISALIFIILVAFSIYCEANVVPTINTNYSSTLGATIIGFNEVKSGAPSFISSASIMPIIISALWSVIAPILLASCFMPELKCLERYLIVIGAIICFIGNIIQSPLIIYSISAICELFYFTTIAFTVNKLLEIQVVSHQKSEYQDLL